MSFASDYPKECTHTILRMLERFGLAIGESSYNHLCLEIAGNDATLAWSEPKSNQDVYRVELNGLQIFCVWCKRRLCVTTVLKIEIEKLENLGLPK